MILSLCPQLYQTPGGLKLDPSTKTSFPYLWIHSSLGIRAVLPQCPDSAPLMPWRCSLSALVVLPQCPDSAPSMPWRCSLDALVVLPQCPAGNINYCPFV